MAPLRINTTDSKNYKFKPMNFGSLHFTVQTPNDAHIVLTTTPDNQEPKYEIFLGGWGNTKSSIGKNIEEPENVIVETPNILDDSEARGFWIKWGGGFIGVGKQGEEKAFLTWYDEEPLNVSYFGVRSSWGASCVWNFQGTTLKGIMEKPKPRQVQWIRASNGHVPSDAMLGGYDVNKEKLYIVRAEHNGALIPGKLVPSHGVAYVAWGGLENPKEDYEVLCNCHGVWKKAIDGLNPVGAISSGYTENGEPLFVGRGEFNRSLVVGKVQPSHGVCYVPFGGKEVSLSEYEVLIASTY